MTIISVNDPGMTVADDGKCTLVEAIEAANTDASSGVKGGECAAGGAQDTIKLAEGATYILTDVNNTVDGPNGLPSITGEITIDGQGATIERSSLNNTPAFRIFHVAESGRLTVKKLMIGAGRMVVKDQISQHGGGVYNKGALMVVESTFLGNQTIGEAGQAGHVSGGGGGGGGGAGGFGGAIFNDSAGQATIINSTFSNNEAHGGDGGNGQLVKASSNGNGGDGGGPGGLGGFLGFPGGPGQFSGGGGGGSGTSVGGTAGGRAGFGGGGGGGGGHTRGGSGGAGGKGSLGGGLGGQNDSRGGGGGGGGAGLGGAIFNNGGAVMIEHSTFTNNSALGGSGGVGAYDTGHGQDGLGFGGAVYNKAGTMMLKNTILANNPAGGDCSLYEGTIVSLGYNLISDDSCPDVFTVSGDITSSDPLLGPLQNNGDGNTPTYALLPGSPAINGVADTEKCTLDTDQRGLKRPQGEFCDIGAYEVSSDVNLSAITLHKIVKGQLPGSDWKFELNNQDFTSFAPAGGSKNFVVEPGVYTLSEIAKPGYSVSVACTGNVEGGHKVSFELAALENIDCTFTAVRKVNSITIVKQTRPAWGAGFMFDSQWGQFTLDDGETYTQDNLPAGTYTIKEVKDSFSGPWSLLSVMCKYQENDLINVLTPEVTDTDTAFVVDISFEVGQDLICIFHNERANYEASGEERYHIFLPFIE